MNEQILNKSLINKINELKKKENRDLLQLSFAEGKNVLTTCIEKKIPIEYIVIDKNKKDLFNELIKKIDKSKIYWTDEQNLLRVSTTKTSYFCITVFKIPNIIDTIDENKIDHPNFNLIIDELFEYFEHEKFICGFLQISDPGNLGTIIRTSIGFNQNKIILFEPNCDPFSPKVIRSSSGAIFNIEKIISVKKDLEEKFLSKIKEKTGYINLKLAFAESSIMQNNKNEYIDLSENKKIRLPIFLLFGNEGKGISEKLRKLKDLSISIPQSDLIESYNLSISHAILTYSLYLEKLNR